MIKQEIGVPMLKGNLAFLSSKTSAKPAIRRSGVSAERRKPLEIEECGFLPKAATLRLQRFHFAGKSKLARAGRRNESKTCLRREVNYPFPK